MRLCYLILPVVLAACGHPPSPDAAPPPDDNALYGDVTPGLNDIEPDHCGAAAFDVYLGQPVAVLEGVPVSREYRVVPFDGIVTQEYDAYRINFRLNDRAKIAKVDCG